MVKRCWKQKKMARHDAFQLKGSGWNYRIRKTKKGWCVETIGRRKKKRFKGIMGR